LKIVLDNQPLQKFCKSFAKVLQKFCKKTQNFCKGIKHRCNNPIGIIYNVVAKIKTFAKVLQFPLQRSESIFIMAL
jgi:hypothetical protein